jgi:hypothetical protein
MTGVKGAVEKVLSPINADALMEDPMRGAHKAKEMKRRASQRRAAHNARLAALTLKAETRRSAVEAGRGKTKVGSKGAAKSTGRASKREKR